MKRCVTTHNATGNVVAQWRGGDEQTLPARAGHTYIDVTGSDTDYSGQRWNGTAFEPIPPAPARVISPLDFARRFTLAEDGALDALADSNRIVKAWMRRLSLATSADLDHQDVINGLAYLKSVGIPAVWPDAATADTRIAAIRA